MASGDEQSQKEWQKSQSLSCQAWMSKRSAPNVPKFYLGTQNDVQKEFENLKEKKANWDLGMLPSGVDSPLRKSEAHWFGQEVASTVESSC